MRSCNWLIVGILILGHQITASADDALELFQKRILPIMNAPNPSSCSECHLSGVDLKNYIHPTQSKTFASLRKQGLININDPEQSKILEFIARAPKSGTTPVSEKVRQQELEAFKSWIVAAVKSPALLDAKFNGDLLNGNLPNEVIRHARKDRVIHSFVENVWSEVNRCAACHSPDRNQKQVEKWGEEVSWITLRNPKATMDHMLKHGIINPTKPLESTLLTKPTMQVEHGGGLKMSVGDRTYRQFQQFLEDYAKVANGSYKVVDDIPEPTKTTLVSSNIWLKLTHVPEKYHKQLLRVDIHEMTDRGGAGRILATGDRPVFGPKQLWQQSLSIVAHKGTDQARLAWQRMLAPGRYVARIYIDSDEKLADNKNLTKDDLISEIKVESRWARGYGQMTIVSFPDLPQ